MPGFNTLGLLLFFAYLVPPQLLYGLQLYTNASGMSADSGSSRA